MLGCGTLGLHTSCGGLALWRCAQRATLKELHGPFNMFRRMLVLSAAQGQVLQALKL